MGERERLALRLAQAQLHRAQAAQREIDVFGARRNRERVDRLRKRGNQASLPETRPSSRSEWPDRYFVPASTARSTPCACGGKNSGVAQVLSMMTQTPRSRAAAAIAGMSCMSSDLRSRRLDEYGARVAAHQRADPGAERGIVIGGLDAHALEDRVAIDARRPIGRVGHQQMIAGAQARWSARR